jgi:hypothetical protein
MPVRTACANNGMETLQEELQRIHDAGVGVWISWLWDGGVDLRLVDESGPAIDEGQVAEVAKALAWLESVIDRRLPETNYRPGSQIAAGELQTELQKIYDSEINIEISWVGNGPVGVKLGNEFYGFDEEGTVSSMSEVLPWLQTRIHEHYAESKYDVERLGTHWTPKWFGPKFDVPQMRESPNGFSEE